jgi:hypothetical protein
MAIVSRPPARRRKRHNLVMIHQQFDEAKANSESTAAPLAAISRFSISKVTQSVDLSRADGPQYSNLPATLTYPQIGQTDDTSGL